MPEHSTIEVETVRLSIASKILATLAALVFLFAGVTGWAGWQSLQVQRQLQITVDQHMARLARLSDLGNQLLQLRRTEKDISIDMSLRAQAVPRRIEHFVKLSDATRAMTKELVPRGDPAEDAALEKLSTALARYLDGMAGPVAAVKRGEVLEMAVFEMDIDAPKKAVRMAEEATTAAISAVKERVTQERAALDQRLRHMQVALAGGLLLTLALSGVAAIVLLRNLRRPIAALGEGIERLKNGETGHRVPSFGHDELGQMTEHFNDMASRLTTLIAEVRAASQSIATASAKVAQGNADLSERTEQTASSLQQTVATMDQLTGAVRQSAEAAHQARELAESAEQACERGGVVVTSAVEGMDGMRHSSQQIAEIIGLIDTIAFQTNILALNAAVEAARAGEEGKGFAVVASEVRGLASRSAEAANDIKRLIKTSLEQVDIGAVRVIEAGSLMSELLDHVRRVRSAMDDISRAAHEQRDDISQVHQAMNELDQVTQQNAALVVQSSEAAQSMSQQADSLARSVQVFAKGRHAGRHSLQPA